MREIEAKVIGIDREAVESRLAELGAELEFDGLLTAVFFDFPDGRLGAAGSLLRLRREGDRNLLTFKQRAVEQVVKVREETELIVGCFEACRQVLQALGMRETFRVEKHRTGYRLGSSAGSTRPGPAAGVVIDRYCGNLSHIPEFLEIEAGSAEEVRSVAARLGFAPDELKPWGMAQLIEHYRQAGRDQ